MSAWVGLAGRRELGRCSLPVGFMSCRNDDGGFETSSVARCVLHGWGDGLGPVVAGSWGRPVKAFRVQGAIALGWQSHSLLANRVAFAFEHTPHVYGHGL